MSEKKNKGPKDKKINIIYLSALVFIGLIIITFFEVNQIKNLEKETISIEEIKTVKRGDLLLYAKPSSQILYVSAVNESTLCVLFYPGIPVELKEMKSLAPQLKRIVRKNDTDYAAIATKFLQQ